MSIVYFFWFMVYAKLFDQYVQYMSDTIDRCQKPLIRSYTHLRSPIRDEMGRTSIWKSKVSERAYRRFMFGNSFFSMMQDCDHDPMLMVQRTRHVRLCSPRRAASTQITQWRATRQRRQEHQVAGARETPFSRAAIVIPWVEDSSEKVITI